MVRYIAPLATSEQLKRVHTSEHIAFRGSSRARASSAGLAYLDPDTAMNRYSLRAAYRAAGLVILATDLVVEGR